MHLFVMRIGKKVEKKVCPLIQNIHNKTIIFIHVIKQVSKKTKYMRIRFKI